MDGFTPDEFNYFKSLVSDFHKTYTLPGVLAVSVGTVAALRFNFLPRHPQMFIYPRHFFTIGLTATLVDAYCGRRYIMPRFNERYPNTLQRIQNEIEQKAKSGANKVVPNPIAMDSAGTAPVTHTKTMSPEEEAQLIRKFRNEYFWANTLPIGLVALGILVYRHRTGGMKPIPTLPPWLPTLQFYNICLVLAMMSVDHFLSPMYAKMKLKMVQDQQQNQSVAPLPAPVVGQQGLSPPAEVSQPEHLAPEGVEENLSQKTRTYDELRRDNRLNIATQPSKPYRPPVLPQPQMPQSKAEPKTAHTLYGDEGFTKG